MSIKLVKNNPHAPLLLVLFFGFVVLFFTPQNTSAATISRPPSNLGLVGYWSMDEGSGSVANDSSGNGDFGSVSGATWANGKRGKSLNFDGTDDYLDLSNKGLGDPNNFGGTNGKVSISLWLKPTRSTGVVYDTILRRIGGMHYMAIVGDGSNRFIRLMVWNEVASANYWPDSISTIPVDTWTHVVFILEAGVGYSFYINGVLDRSESVPGLVIGNYGSSDSAFGAKLDSGASFFKGQIDDVRLYNRVLTAAEVSAMYKSGQVTRKTVSNSGLVGYWPLNEGTGTVAGDSSGNGNVGSISGATWTEGKRGKALSFDGTSNCVSLGTSSTLRPQDGTYSAWIKLSSLPSDGNVGGDIFSNYSGNSKGMFLSVLSNGYLHLRPHPSGNVNSTYALSTGRWYHVVGQIEGSATRLYINGVLDNSSTGTYTPPDGMNASIGCWVDAAGFYFPGVIDDVRIYNRALSAAEVAALYKQNETTVNANTNSRITDGLVGAWSFNGNNLNMASSTAEILDVSGNGNHGDNSGGRADAGKIGQGWKFDGADDYVAIGDTSVLDLSTQGSLSIWARPDRSMPSDDANYYYRNFISKSYGGSTATVVYSFHWHGTNSLSELRMCTSTGAAATCQTYNIGALTVGDWYNFAVTWNTAANSLIFYVNGAAVSSLTNSNAAQNSATSLYIGGCTFGCGANQNWDGQLDEARVYNRALSAEEMKQLYNMGK